MPAVTANSVPAGKSRGNGKPGDRQQHTGAAPFHRAGHNERAVHTLVRCRGEHSPRRSVVDVRHVVVSTCPRRAVRRTVRGTFTDCASQIAGAGARCRCVVAFKNTNVPRTNGAGGSEDEAGNVVDGILRQEVVIPPIRLLRR